MAFLRNTDISKKEMEASSRLLKHREQKEKELYSMSWKVPLNRVVAVVKSLSILCDPRDCSLPGSSVHGISQARILEGVAISFSRGSSRSRDQTRISCIGRQILNH